MSGIRRSARIFLTVCIFALAGIAGAAAQEAQKANPAADFKYDLNEAGDGVVIQKYKGKATAVVIPAVIEDFPVVEVGYRAFEETNIVSIILPDSIRRIGYSCFKKCTSLQNVVLPKNLKYLSEELFYGCTALKTITLPNSIEKIYSGAFSSSGLESITIPDNVKQIGGRSNNRGAFGSCKNLRTVTIGNGTEAIGEDTFADCENLKTVNIGNGTEVIESRAFSGCSALSLKEKQKIRKTGYDGGF